MTEYHRLESRKLLPVIHTRCPPPSFHWSYQLAPTLNTVWTAACPRSIRRMAGPNPRFFEWCIIYRGMACTEIRNWEHGRAAVHKNLPPTEHTRISFYQPTRNGEKELDHSLEEENLAVHDEAISNRDAHNSRRLLQDRPPHLSEYSWPSTSDKGANIRADKT
jgi:hypothetical protein